MRSLDFSSWQGLLSTLLGLILVTIVAVGLRLVVMQRVQRNRERENRQINERLRTLIAAYKTLGGSFTGELAVNPQHLRDLQVRPAGDDDDAGAAPVASSDRSRRIRDAVEAALSDIILLGTEEQVLLAARAATELAEGRAAHTHELVVSLRNFIRAALDLDAVPAQVSIPRQGPARPGGGSGGGKGGRAEGGKEGRGSGGGAGGGGAGLGMQAGVGGGTALGARTADDDHDDTGRG